MRDMNKPTQIHAVGLQVEDVPSYKAEVHPPTHQPSPPLTFSASGPYLAQFLMFSQP